MSLADAQATIEAWRVDYYGCSAAQRPCRSNPDRVCERDADECSLYYPTNQTAIISGSELGVTSTHLRTRASAAAPGGARSPPSTRRPSGPGAVRRPAPAHPAHGASPRPPAHVRGRSGWAMVPRGAQIGPRRHRPPAGDRRPHRPRGAPAGRSARKMTPPPSVGAREVSDHAVYSANTRSTPNEFPIDSG